MKKITQTVWTDDKGRELIVKTDDNDFRVMPSGCDRETLQELAAACYDATKPQEDDDGDIEKALKELNEEVKL
jgi:hypothetical protein